MPLHHTCHRLVIRALALGLLATTLSGCEVQPLRPYTQSAIADSPCASAATDRLRTTPELADDGAYTLHYVEFDDQGWTFPNGTGADGVMATPSRQIDCAIGDLRHKLETADTRVLLLLYVHGWKHSADNQDRDVNRFRSLLRSRAALFKDRHVVGIYVGWQGHTLDVAGLDNLTFWGRKNAADHVSEGRVRELFSRVRGLRSFWNGPTKASDHDCDWQQGSGPDRCRLRTIMIGHSFGGLILYNSVSPYLLELLSNNRDIPAGEKPPPVARARSIADLIVLLNPAFEGSRYEAVHQASMSYHAGPDEPPLMVMLTSTGDLATKNAFPAARWINSVFQYPASSEAESVAMRRTPGHIDGYQTHHLCLGDAACPAPAAEAAASAPAADDAATLRPLCGGMRLRSGPLAAGRPIVWNVRTDPDIIPDHNSIDRPQVFSFIEQLYADVTQLKSSACKPDG